jgi:hypothetical protein
MNKFNLDSKIKDVINDPIFNGYGKLLFPVERGYYSGNTLKELKLTWYSNISPSKTVEIVNYLYNKAKEGNKIFYDIYSEEEKRKDKNKRKYRFIFF